MKKRQLSPGKFRALQRATTPDGHFTILALDHQDALRRALSPTAPESVTQERMITFKRQVIQTLAPEASGVLLDPIFSATQAIEGGYLGCAGLLVELEKADYQMKPMPLDCELLPDWSVAKIKRMGADGAKLFFYYNPDDAVLAARQDRLIGQIVDGCALADLPLYAEPILYSVGEDNAAYAAKLTQRVIESARRVAALGADVLKLEFPAPPDALDDSARCLTACQEISGAVSVPWVLLSAGVSFEDFVRQVEIACRAGASGYIAGRAVWGEAAVISDDAERQRWLETIGRDRLRRLTTNAAVGPSWTNIVECEPASTGWYRTYPGQENP